MTNYEKIKNMSIEEMAKFIMYAANDCNHGCMFCAFNDDGFGECMCEDDEILGCEEWLKQKAEQ